MIFFKSKSDLKLKICFTPQELAVLLLTKDILAVTNIAKNNLSNLDEAKKLTVKLAKVSANSKDYELFTAIFVLYDLFDSTCQFCFNLNSKFSLNKGRINKLEDLEKFKEDTPDVIVYHQNGFYDFELKRYRGKLNVDALFDFINKKIISHYSDHNRNYFIILQPEAYKQLPQNLFKNLNIKLNKLKRNFGMIAISLNNNNKEMLTVMVYPDLKIFKSQFT